MSQIAARRLRAKMEHTSLQTIHEIKGEGFTHQYLWNCAKTLLLQPETKSPKDGYFQMAGMVMAYFVYEAYLNLVGARVDREAWQNERQFFSRQPYRGTDGKLRRICEEIGIEIERDKRPFKTILELARLRNFLAHGKREVYAYDVDVKKGQDPDMFDGLSIYKMVTRTKSDRALIDIEEFIEYLHAKIAEKRPNDRMFKGKALKFPLALAFGGTKLSS